jgi:hypothetical protein
MREAILQWVRERYRTADSRVYDVSVDFRERHFDIMASTCDGDACGAEFLRGVEYADPRMCDQLDEFFVKVCEFEVKCDPIPP